MRDPAWLNAAEHAAAVYPREACGVLLGTEGALEFVALPNRASAPGRYEIDPGALLGALRGPAALIAFVHSHADAGSGFSREDREHALLEGRPLWPGVQYLVISVERGRAVEGRMYRWDPSLRTFTETEVHDWTDDSRIR